MPLSPNMALQILSLMDYIFNMFFFYYLFIVGVVLILCVDRSSKMGAHSCVSWLNVIQNTILRNLHN